MGSDGKNWADHPVDILAIIREKLVRGDRIRMSTCCNHWNNCYKSNKESNNEVLPWLLGYHSSTKLLELSDLDGGTRYFLKPKCHIDFDHVEILALKRGWMLFLSIKGWTLFFYNPFTNEIIELPKLPTKLGIVSTFLSIPSSHDCVVIVSFVEYRKIDFFLS